MKEINSLFQKYNPRIDGLRALAILFIIFYHYRIPGFTGGGYGVDIFFVLSGFLMTLSLIKSQKHGESVFISYWRRFLRLMPPLVFMCIGFLVFSIFFNKMIPLKVALQDIFVSISFISNWTRAFLVGSPVVIPVVLGHTWFLAIEQQFYLFWPPFFIFLSSRKNGKNILAISTALLFISTIWSFYAGFNNFGNNRIYNGFDTHSFVLIMGCCLALFSQNSRSERIYKYLSKIWPFGIVGMIYLIRFMKIEENYTSHYSMYTGVLAILLIISTYYDPNSFFGKFLELKPLVAIGKISYGLYLWHYPIWLILYTFRLSWSAVTWIGIPLSFIVATISYQLIEKKLLRFRDKPDLPLKNLGIISLTVSIVGMFLGGLIYIK